MPTSRERGLQQAQQEAQRLAAQMSAAPAPAGAPGQQPVTTGFAPGTMPAESQSLLDSVGRAVPGGGVQQEVIGAPGRRCRARPGAG